ncbi:MAG: protein-L-isoaspartate(D-aspartate) O-methyltransferase [Comamonas sp.]|nr:protein-L-isoaspartate(D-aspartate) O-methyltransferase [Comamonas sp.]
MSQSPLPRKRPGFPADVPIGGSVSSPARARPATSAQHHVPVGWGLDSDAVRQRMVQRLAAGGIQSQAVLTAMGQVPRHHFVDSALASQAYEDTSLPIGLQQTISKPSVVARMIELLLGASAVAEQGLGRVLEIGTGCGYQAAVLSCLARQVYSIERLRGLHEKARVNLRPLRLMNVHLILGDGMKGYPQGGPYAGIISAAGGQSIPHAWLEQLAIGARLVAPTEHTNGQQVLRVIERTAQGFVEDILEAVHFVPLKSGVA